MNKRIITDTIEFYEFFFRIEGSILVNGEVTEGLRYNLTVDGEVL